MSSSIKDAFCACHGHLERLITTGHLDPYESEIPKVFWTDELGRLRVWAMDNGVVQKGQSSLDYRLRDSSPIKRQTMDLLLSLQQLLDDIEEGLDYPDDDGSDDTDGHPIETSEIHDIYQAIVDTITCLYRVSAAIRQPASHDQIFATAGKETLSLIRSDCQTIRDQFPRASNTVLERLELGISRRRTILSHRQRQYRDPAEESKAESHKEASSTSTFYHEMTPRKPDDRFLIPGLPGTLVPGKMFKCPCCYFMISVGGYDAWIWHLCDDLLPYMCVFSDCPVPNRLYSSRSKLYEHMNRKHWKWDVRLARECPLCMEETSIAEAEQHLARHLEDIALYALPFQGSSRQRGESANELKTEIPEGSSERRHSFQGAFQNQLHISDLTRKQAAERRPSDLNAQLITSRRLNTPRQDDSSLSSNDFTRARHRIPYTSESRSSSLGRSGKSSLSSSQAHQDMKRRPSTASTGKWKRPQEFRQHPQSGSLYPGRKPSREPGPINPDKLAGKGKGVSLSSERRDFYIPYYDGGCVEREEYFDSERSLGVCAGGNGGISRKSSTASQGSSASKRRMGNKYE